MVGISLIAIVIFTATNLFASKTIFAEGDNTLASNKNFNNLIKEIDVLNPEIVFLLG